MAATGPAAAQTRLKLSSINPGTEIVVLVTNGDFQAQGTATSTNTHPNPTGWTRQADMFADPGTNLVAVNNGVVACALVNGGASVCQYKRSLTLEAATDYVLSAYLWNLGDGANHVTTVIDLKTVSLISPTDGTNMVFASAPANLPIVASAADPDGTIAKVEYYAATTKLGETTAPLYSAPGQTGGGRLGLWVHQPHQHPGGRPSHQWPPLPLSFRLKAPLFL